MSRKIVIELDVSADFNAEELFDQLCELQTEKYPAEMWPETSMTDNTRLGRVSYTHDEAY